ncbi:methionyl-tRNA formyltransferase [Rhodocytophaga aerolata]
MGTPEFAVPSLEILLQHNYPVVAVITAPDKPSGRGLKLTPSPVKEVAVKYHIPVLQPTNLKSPEFIEELKSYGATLQIVVAFRMLPEAVWNMPEIGTFNLHASLLPQYRGAAPINWAIINGETETGLTTFFLKHEIDTGNIIFQEKEPIYEHDTAGRLYERLRQKGARLVLQTVQAIESGTYPQIPQQLGESIKTAPKIYKETCEINWNQPAKKVYDFVRGLSPYPTAWTTLQDKFYKIYAIKGISSENSMATPGTIVTDSKEYIRIRTQDGWVAIDELQQEGKKKMKTAEFLRGNTL